MYLKLLNCIKHYSFVNMYTYIHTVLHCCFLCLLRSRLLRCLGTVYNLEVVQGYIAEEEFVNMYINWTGKKAGHSDWGSLSTENVCTLKGEKLYVIFD